MAVQISVPPYVQAEWWPRYARHLMLRINGSADMRHIMHMINGSADIMPPYAWMNVGADIRAASCTG